jgi:ABC-type taurine transport system substrate-binding protein
MVVPYRFAQEAKEIEKQTGYKINWKQFGGGGEGHQGDGFRRGADRRSRLGRYRAALSRGEPYELFWILDDIGDAEALVAKNGSGHQLGRRPEGQEDRDAVQLDDALPHDGCARAGEGQSRPTCRS